MLLLAASSLTVRSSSKNFSVMISATAWVPRGFAAEFPEKYELDDVEMERISAMAKLQLGNAEDEEVEDEEVETKKLQNDLDIDDDLKEYDLEHYDDDEQEGSDVTMLPGLSGTSAKYHDGEDGKDPYLTLPNEDEVQEERQESQIYPTDNLLLATRTEDEISYLDVYVYDDGAGAPQGAEEEEEDKLDKDVAKGLVRDAALYVHHDLMLPAFPLCVEWVNYRPGQANVEGDNIGNFAAIGTFDPQIEIWNLDCIDKAFPDVILGEPEQNSFSSVSKKNKKKKKSKSQHITTHHTDAVLSLTHNRLHRNVLASSSADHTVKLWDLNNATAVRSFDSIHNKKTVASSQWHPSESSILLTGGYNGNCAITDVRIADDSTKSYYVNGEDVENVRWGHGATPEIFYCGTDSGNVYSFDIRQQDKPLWTLHAHDAGISSLDINSHIPGMIVTSAMGEKTVKLWKGSNTKGPSMVLSRDFDVGNVLTTGFAGDVEVAGNLAIGGVSGGLKMWDILSNRSVRNSFKTELQDLQKKAREDAKTQGKASRIARKYKGDSNDNVMTVEEGSDSEEEDDEEENGMEDEE